MNNILKRQEPWCDWMDLNHRRAFSLLLYQLSYNRIRYSAYKANCTLSSEPRIIDKSYYVTPFGVVLPTRFQRARSLLQRFLRPLCLAFHHGSISKLSVQQSTVFPICQTVSPNKLLTRSSQWCFGWDLNPHACAEVFETPLSADSSTETYMLVFPSRHCLRRSFLYFKHHVVHVIIFTVIDRCSDNILRIWVQLASAKISV